MRLRSSVELHKLDQGLVNQLESAERFCGLEFEITSGYRSGDPRCHGNGKAVDIACTRSADRRKIVKGLEFAGIRRVGLYSNHIHADVCQGDDYVPEILWLGGASK